MPLNPYGIEIGKDNGDPRWRLPFPPQTIYFKDQRLLVQLWEGDPEAETWSPKSFKLAEALLAIMRGDCDHAQKLLYEAGVRVGVDPPKRKTIWDKEA